MRGCDLLVFFILCTVFLTGIPTYFSKVPNTCTAQHWPIVQLPTPLHIALHGKSAPYLPLVNPLSQHASAGCRSYLDYRWPAWVLASQTTPTLSLCLCSASCFLPQKWTGSGRRDNSVGFRERAACMQHLGAHRHQGDPRYPQSHSRVWVLFSWMPASLIHLFTPAWFLQGARKKQRNNRVWLGAVPCFTAQSRGLQAFFRNWKASKKGCVGVYEFYLHNYPII